MTGYGWGLTSALLADKNENDTISVQKLIVMYNAFPHEAKKSLLDGLYYAFNKEVTPVLNSNLQKTIDRYIY